jgi:hypothetical protein
MSVEKDGSLWSGADSRLCISNEAAPLVAGQFPVSVSISIRRCAKLFRLLSLRATFLFLQRDESPTSECRLWRRIG